MPITSVQRGFTLTVTSFQGFLGIVSNSLILNNHILSGLPYLVSSIGDARHLLALLLGGFGERMGIGRTQFHFVPLKSYEETGKRVDANNYDCPPKSRSLIAAQLSFYIFEFVGGAGCVVTMELIGLELWICGALSKGFSG